MAACEGGAEEVWRESETLAVKKDVCAPRNIVARHVEPVRTNNPDERGSEGWSCAR
jgi:hypothetical protein